VWSLKTEKFPSEIRSGETWEREFMENDEGVRVVFDRLGRRIEDAEFTFTYADSELSFAFVAHKRDRASSPLADWYTVEIGVPLERLSRKFGPNFMTVDRARKIANDIKGALLIWRLPQPVVEILGCAPVASEVFFDYRGWSTADMALGKDLP
jgi:hypothetical protein